MKTRFIREFKTGIRATTLRSAQCRRSEVHLIFGNGPDPVGTTALLDVLRRHGVAATFFLNAEAARRFPDAVDAIVVDGHLMGNDFTRQELSGCQGNLAQWEEMRVADRVLRRHDHIWHHPSRPPRGGFRTAFGFWLALRGRDPVHWSLDSGDSECSDVDELITHLREYPPGPGDVLLFHDDSPVTPRALEQLLPEWKAAGLTFAVLPGWDSKK